MQRSEDAFVEMPPLNLECRNLEPWSEPGKRLAWPIAVLLIFFLSVGLWIVLAWVGSGLF